MKVINLHELVTKQKEFFYTDVTKSVSFRLNMLQKLKNVIKLYELKILDALKKDLGKSNYEGFVTEVGIIYNEINYVMKNLRKWDKIKKVKTPFIYFGSKSYIKHEPYGVVLIISPWNYPFQLSISPLIGAIAGGNTVILKPSEHSLHTTDVIYEMITEYFKEEYIAVVKGDKTVTEKLLAEKLDYIFFTGSGNVGKIIMEKAAKNLTPVTLELGGKSPAIVCKDADIDKTCKAIVFGKFINSGQTCVAPDYVLVDETIKDDFIKKLIFYIEKFYPDALNNEYYPKIINAYHFKRLIKYLEDSNVIYGGHYDESKLKIEPTLVTTLYDDEIFGPILPILNFNNLDEVVKIIRSRPKALALYLFTYDKQVMRRIMQLEFGGGCINDTLMHLSTPFLPFGGLGESGMGNYHGYYSYKTFTHQKSVFKKGKIDISLRYPPYDDKKLSFIKKLFK